MKLSSPLIITLLRFLSALPFAIYYSSLQLYLLDVNFSQSLSTSLVGSILALSFGSSLAGGVLGGRYISFNALFIFSVVCEALGCLTFSTSNPDAILWYCSLFLLGSAGVTLSLNMLITQRYQAEDVAREKSFFWLYMVLNMGYFVGYTVSGYYGKANHYHNLPIVIMAFSLVAIIIALFNRDTINRKINFAFYKFIAITGSVFLGIRLLLQFSQTMNLVIIAIWLTIACITFVLLIRNYSAQRNQIMVFYILLIAAIVFWSVYFLAPMAVIVFIKYYVNLKLFNIVIAPQWIQNINTIIIIFGTIIWGIKAKSALFKPGFIIFQFTGGLLLMGLGMITLMLGIYLKGSSSNVALPWVVCSYILQSIGELLIGPVGYALIGRLIPKSHQSIMMGVWIAILGVASIIASKLSILVPYISINTSQALTQYQHFFFIIAIITIAIAVIIYLGSKNFVKRLA